MFGLLNIAKPRGLSSYDVIRRVRRALVEAGGGKGVKVGHAGTLDVLADGVLVVCLGPAVRLAEIVQAYDKEYQVLAHLGATSITDDAEGQITPTPEAAPPSPQAIEQVAPKFVGIISQVPPAYSAVHVAGGRAYQLARRGKAVELAARSVTIHSVEVLSYQYPRLRLCVRCGSGTYIRALVRDLGRELTVGAYCQGLTRTRLGPFRLEQAARLDDLTGESLAQLLISPVEAIPADARVTVPDGQAGELALGRAVPAPSGPSPQIEAALLGALDPAGRLIALVRLDRAANLLRPEKVFIRMQER